MMLNTTEKFICTGAAKSNEGYSSGNSTSTMAQSDLSFLDVEIDRYRASEVATVHEPYLNPSACSSSYQFTEDRGETAATFSNYLQIAWTGDLLSLKQFVSETLKLEGQWSQSGGDKKVFTSGTNTISWRKKRKDLQFKGTDADLLKRTVCVIMKGTDNFNNKATNSVNGPTTCQSKCSELATDIEGIKLDQFVNERRILDNSSRIKEIGEVLTKLEKQNDEMRQQIHNMNEVTEPLQNRLQQTTRFEYVNNSRRQQSQQNSKQHPRYRNTSTFPQEIYIERCEGKSSRYFEQPHQKQMNPSPNMQAPLPLMSLSLNPTPQQKKAWPDFVRRETIGNKANKLKFTRLREEDFPMDQRQRGKLNFFSF